VGQQQTPPNIAHADIGFGFGRLFILCSF
ncbi:uncharacterized protein METZ01_LOCUS310076, partial [marine metagenome]